MERKLVVLMLNGWQMKRAGLTNSVLFHNPTSGNPNDATVFGNAVSLEEAVEWAWSRSGLEE